MPHGTPFRRLTAQALALVLSIGVGGCAGNVGPSLDSPGRIDLSPKKPNVALSRGEGAVVAGTQRGGTQIFPGTLQDPRDTQSPPAGITAEGDKFSINVEDASVAATAQLVLGETLRVNFLIDPRVQGSITLSSVRPLSEKELLDSFEAALRLIGAGLIKSDDSYKIVALQELADGAMGSADLKAKRTTAGFGVSVIPLRYIGTAKMIELLDSFIARSGTIRASAIGNAVLVRGTAAERQSLVEVIMSFDVDWMKSQTASIAILANGTPDEMVSKLEAIFAQDTENSGGNGMKIIPLERLNGVVIISNSQNKVRRALSWVGRLDKASVTDTNYFVYAVQNGNAANLAKILSATFIDGESGPGTSADVAPDQETVELSTSPSESDTPAKTTTPNLGLQGKSDREDMQPPVQSSETFSQEPKSGNSAIRITPNVANNTIVIRANQREYARILATLRKIDSPAAQVLISTTIAEVALNDTLRYGVQAYFKNDNVLGGVFNGDGLALRPSFPGLNVLLGGAADPRIVIDALSGVTNVRVVSSPSLLVLENETALIKVGDQVPVKTQTVANAVGGSVDSFEYRDTGVILKVRPRINAAGLVTMEIGQELSSVSAGSGSSVTERQNPTFSQRSITSKVSVYSTQTVVLGGLIAGQDNKQRDSVPGVNKIPLIGKLIGKTDNTAKRNELIVFITPTIIKDGEDASRVSEELRDKMQLLNWD